MNSFLRIKKYSLSIIVFLISTISFAAIWVPMPPESYNFSPKFPQAQNLLFAFDYGHALLYEKLITLQGVDSLEGRTSTIDFKKLEDETLAQVFKILKNPPQQKVDEEEIAPQYVFYFSWLAELFDWSHLLHQFSFDILTTYPNQAVKIDERMKDIVATYQKNKRIAIPLACRTMGLMDDHYYSKIFRKVMPRYNQLIWAYHWFQIKLYDDILLPTYAEQKAAVDETFKKFWQLVSSLPESSGFEMMPMASEVAPNFYRKYPEVAWSFDANHMAHDIINDILVSPLVPVDKKVKEGFNAAKIVLDKNQFSCQGTGENPEHVIEGMLDGSCKPDMLHLTKGQKVDIILKSSSEMFVFIAPDFKIDLMSMPGQPARATVTPKQTGTFPFTCSKHGAPRDQVTNGKIMVM